MRLIQVIEPTLFQLCKKKLGSSIADVQVTELTPGSVEVNFAVITAETVGKLSTGLTNFLNDEIQNGSLASLGVNETDLVRAKGEICAWD